jgi:hypothetical protein
MKLEHFSLREGAYNTLWASTATGKSIPQSGVAYEPVGKVIEPTKQSADRALAERLWDWTQQELKPFS